MMAERKREEGGEGGDLFVCPISNGQSEEERIASALYASDTVCACMQAGRHTGSIHRCARDNFHLKFCCRWLFVFTLSGTAVTKILFNGVMSTTYV